MLLSALTISPYIVATVIGLAYLWYIGGRWSWPCLIDVALLALYVARPGLPLLALVLSFGIIRHTPALAREVAVLIGLATFEGWTIRAAIFALPALKRYADESADNAELPPMVTPSASQPQPQATAPLSFSAAQAQLNDDPSAPHLGVIGATRLGKTTFVGVLLAYRYTELVIATPKAAQYDPWFGADVARPVATADDIDFAPIEQAVNSVYREMLRRNTPGASATPTITLVLDEWTQIAELPGVVKKVVQMLRMGAACGIRLVLMATDVNVRGWKMDGVAGVIDNLIFAKVEDGRRWSIGRLDANWRLVDPRQVDARPVLGLAQRVSLAGRGWAGVRAEPVPAGMGADPLLGGLLSGVGVGALPVGVGVAAAGVGGGPPDPRAFAHAHTQTNDAEKRIAMYLEWRRAKLTREQARTIRHAAGDGLDDGEWAEAGKRLANGPN